MRQSRNSGLNPLPVKRGTIDSKWAMVGRIPRGVLDASPEGIVVCESSSEHQPVVYVNNAFERMSGYGADELIGHDLRRLQSWDRDQEGRNQLRAAICQGESCRVLLRNYRKDGTQFWNEMLVQPLRGAEGSVTHFVGFHRDVTERERSGLRRSSAACRPGCARTGCRVCVRAHTSRSCCSTTGRSARARRGW